jgi:hypothetical protein
MHGAVRELIARLRAVLLYRQPPPGTQFFWRFSLGTLPLAISPAPATTPGDGNPISPAHAAASLAATASSAAAAHAITAADEATSAATALAIVASTVVVVTTGSPSTLADDIKAVATTAAAEARDSAAQHDMHHELQCDLDTRARRRAE